MSNLTFISDHVSRKDIYFRVFEKNYSCSNELSDVDFIKLNRRLRYGRQPIYGDSSRKYHKTNFKY